MIDSATINYGLSKLGATINQAAPYLKGVSEQYVHYTVCKTVLFVPITIILTIAAVVGLVYSIKWFKKDSSENPFCILLAVVVVLICSIFTLFALYDCCMALWCPEMFTIQQIIDAARK
jgi:hypothetical protein